MPLIAEDSLTKGLTLNDGAMESPYTRVFHPAMLVSRDCPLRLTPLIR